MNPETTTKAKEKELFKQFMEVRAPRTAGPSFRILTFAPVSDLQDFNTGEPHESAPWELALTHVSENRYAAA